MRKFNTYAICLLGFLSASQLITSPALAGAHNNGDDPVAKWRTEQLAKSGIKEQTPEERLKALKEQADAGNAEAEFRLAKMYEYDTDGIKPDPTLAASLYLKAANQGLPMAAEHLGEMYNLSHGVPKDYAQGLFWRLVAAKAGLNWAFAIQREEINSYTSNGRLNAGQVAAAEKRANEWRPSPIVLGGAVAQKINDMEASVEKDEAVVPDGPIAHRLDFMALMAKASHGDKNAQAYVGLDYATGNIVTQDNVQAYFWLSLAANPDYRKQTEEASNKLTLEQKAATDKKVLEWTATPQQRSP